MALYFMVFFFFQAEDGIRDYKVTGVQTCALPISRSLSVAPGRRDPARSHEVSPVDPRLLRRDGARRRGDHSERQRRGGSAARPRALDRGPRGHGRHTAGERPRRAGQDSGRLRRGDREQSEPEAEARAAPATVRQAPGGGCEPLVAPRVRAPRASTTDRRPPCPRYRAPFRGPARSAETAAPGSRSRPCRSPPPSPPSFPRRGRARAPRRTPLSSRARKRYRRGGGPRRPARPRRGAGPAPPPPPTHPPPPPAGWGRARRAAPRRAPPPPPPAPSPGAPARHFREQGAGGGTGGCRGGFRSPLPIPEHDDVRGERPQGKGLRHHLRPDPPRVAQGDDEARSPSHGARDGCPRKWCVAAGRDSAARRAAGSGRGGADP